MQSFRWTTLGISDSESKEETDEAGEGSAGAERWDGLAGDVGEAAGVFLRTSLVVGREGGGLAERQCQGAEPTPCLCDAPQDRGAAGKVTIGPNARGAPRHTGLIPHLGIALQQDIRVEPIASQYHTPQTDEPPAK